MPNVREALSGDLILRQDTACRSSLAGSPAHQSQALSCKDESMARPLHSSVPSTKLGVLGGKRSGPRAYCAASPKQAISWRIFIDPFKLPTSIPVRRSAQAFLKADDWRKAEQVARFADIGARVFDIARALVRVPGLDVCVQDCVQLRH